MFLTCSSQFDLVQTNDEIDFAFMRFLSSMGRLYKCSKISCTKEPMRRASDVPSGILSSLLNLYLSLHCFHVEMEDADKYGGGVIGSLCCCSTIKGQPYCLRVKCCKHFHRGVGCFSWLGQGSCNFNPLAVQLRFLFIAKCLAD